MLARSVGEALVDEMLRGRMPAAALTDGDLLGLRSQSKDRLRHERIVEDDISFGQEARGARIDQQVPAREIHLVSEHERNGIARHGLLRAGALYGDLSNMRAARSGQSQDLIAHRHCAGLDAAEVAARTVTLRPRGELHR